MGMLPVKHFCLRTVVWGKQGHASCKILLSLDCGWGYARACFLKNTFVFGLWLGVSKGMLPVKYFCLWTVVGGKQGHAS